MRMGDGGRWLPGVEDAVEDGGETPVLQGASASPYTFDVDGRGTCHFYWGLDSQELTDPVLSVPGRAHPAYRNRAVLVMEDFLCGREKTTPPSVELVWLRAPQQEVISWLSAGLDEDGQANLLAGLVELTTSEIDGAGVDASLFDTTSWQALADALYTNRAETFASMGLEGAVRVAAVFEQVNGYLDTWFRSKDGAIEAGRWATGGSYPSDLPVIDENDLTDVPRIAGQALDEAASRIELRFRDRELVYEDNFVRYEHGGNREAVGRENFLQVDRSWVRRGAQAQAMADVIGARESQPRDTTRLSVLQEHAEDLRPGELFEFRYGPLSYVGIMRVVRRRGDSAAGGPVKIDAERERGLAPPQKGGHYAAIGGSGSDAIVDLAYWHPVQLPPALVDDRTYRVALLGGRTQGAVVGARAYFQDAAEEWQFLGAQRTWAVAVQLSAPYADSEPVDDETGALQIEQLDPASLGFDDLETAQSVDEIADDTLLLVILDAAAPEDFEVLTIKSIESPTGGVYPVHVLRARFGTARRSFLANDPAYIVRRSDLIEYTHAAFETLAGEIAPDNVGSFKLVPYGARERLSIADATEKSLAFGGQAGETIIYDGNGDL